MITKRDIARLPAKQRDVLGEICTLNRGGYHPATIKALRLKGLVQAVPVREMTPQGVFTYQRYEVASMGVHIAYCEWASDVVDSASGGAATTGDE